MLTAGLQDQMRNLLVGVVLLVYLIVFAQEVIQCWRGTQRHINEARAYIWSSLGALIGGVAAFYLGVDLTKAVQEALADGRWPSIDTLRALYAAVYIVTGLAAALTWALKPASTTTLIKNAATTFVGLSVAVVTKRLMPDG